MNDVENGGPNWLMEVIKVRIVVWSVRKAADLEHVQLKRLKVDRIEPKLTLNMYQTQTASIIPELGC